MKIFKLTFFIITWTFAKSTVYDQVYEEGTFCPIMDPLDELGPLSVNFTADPVAKFDYGSEITNLHINGLSSLRYNLSLNIVNISYYFEIKIGQVDGRFNFNVTGYFDARPFRQESIPSGNITGDGYGKFSCTQMYIKGSFDLFVDLNENKLGWSKLTLEKLSFENINVDFSSTLAIGGKIINWEEYNRNSKANIEQDFSEHKSEITEQIRQSVNSFLANYEIRDFLIVPSPCPCGEC